MVFDIPVRPLVDESPEYERPWISGEKPESLSKFEEPMDLIAALQALLAGPHLSSRRWVWEQYDHSVMADTVRKPGGDATIIRIHDTTRGLAITTDCTPRYCAAAPIIGGSQAVAEVWRNLSAVGAKPLAITNCLNFGNPERPEIMGQFVDCIKGMSAACTALDFPVVSGNVSLYNETYGQAILPTPAIGGIGILENLNCFADLALRRIDDGLLLIGESTGHLEQSIYVQQLLGLKDGMPPPVDLITERKNGDFIRELIEQGYVNTCHDLSDGGLLVAATEMALSGNIGLTLEGPKDPGFWFGEDQARYLLAVPKSEMVMIIQKAQDKNILVQNIGHTGGNALTLNGSPPICLDELRRLHESWLPNYMENA